MKTAGRFYGSQTVRGSAAFAPMRNGGLNPTQSHFAVCGSRILHNAALSRDLRGFIVCE